MRILVIFMLLFSLMFGQTNDEFDSFNDEFTSEKIESSWDPIKFYNEPMTKFNDFVYMYIMGPITKGYTNITNKPIREGISNAFHNIQYPVRAANNLLQLKFKNTFEETARFVINSTFGLAGFIDLAKIDGGLERHNEDFGQTLGFYGVSNDFHIVLPFLGPSNLRDAVGIFADSFVDPLRYANDKELGFLKSNNTYMLINAHKIINEYSFQIDAYESIRKDSVDLYILLKEVYDQRRNKMIEE